MSQFESKGIDNLSDALTEDELYDECEKSCTYCKIFGKIAECKKCHILANLNTRLDAIEVLHPMPIMA